MPFRLSSSEVREAPGPAWCRAWTDQVDAALTAFAAEGDQRGLAVVALGSYARRELCPASDVDLLLLHAGWDRDDLSQVVQRICYPLWDAGLTVGHAVRTPAQAVAAATERLDTATALTDRRLVAGDAGLLDDLASRAARWLRRSAGRLLDDLAAADQQRRQRAGPRPGMLEPQLKDGAGGLRDLHGLRWAAACLLGEPGLDPLVGAHYLGAAGRRELAVAGQTLLSARCALHLVRGPSARPGAADVDRLRLDLQDEVAARLGMADGVELLRAVGLSTRTVSYVAERVWPQLSEDAQRGRRWLRAGPGRTSATPLSDGLVLRDGAVAVEMDRSLADEPSLGLRSVATAGRLGLWLERGSAERLRREVGETGSLPWDDRSRAALLELLRSGAGALPALADADFMGLLPAHLPEWARIRGRPQRNPFHRFDLDTHLQQTVAELVDLSRGSGTELEAVLYDGLADPDALLLGAFLHDIGKAWPGDHSIAGAEVAASWMRHMGFGDGRGRRVAALVRNHLLLPDVATRRDLDDPAELEAVAAAVGNAETLDGLYLLSLADARATGPAAYSPWKDGLIAELHARVRRLLAGNGLQTVPGADSVASAAQREAGGAVDGFLTSVGRRYLAAAGTEQVLAHAALAASPPVPGELRAAVRPGPAAGTVTLSVVAGDRHGLVADCAGVLAAAGVAVLDARAFRTDEGVALDWFVVRPPEGGADWDRITADLAAAASGDLDVEAAVTARERRRDARPRPLAAPVPVDVAFDLRGSATRVEIHGPDAPGLLYRLAHVLSAAGTDLAGARVTTLGPAVRDVFFLRAAPDREEVPTLAKALHAAAEGS